MAAPTQPLRGYGDIPPVLTPDEWLRARASLGPRPNAPTRAGDAGMAAALIDALPADDRRKLGWDYVDKLRAIASRGIDPLPAADPLEDELRRSTDALALAALADVLASYLPPRPDV